MRSFFTTVLTFALLSIFFTGCFDEKKIVISSELTAEKTIEGTVVRANENFYGAEIISNSTINENDIKFSNSNMGLVKIIQGQSDIVVSGIKKEIKKGDILFILSNKTDVSNLMLVSKYTQPLVSSSKRAANTLTGDFNSDNKVDLLDFVIFKAAYKEPSGTASFNSKCDIAPVSSPDGKVDIVDFCVFANNFGTSQTVDPTITSVTITQSPSTALFIGDTFKYIGEILYSDNSKIATVDWTSSNTSVATIDANGNLTAIAEGTTTITASKLGVSSVGKTVTVSKKTATITSVQITLSPTADIFVGDTFKFTGKINYSDSTSATDVEWTSSNTTVADIGIDGTITAKAAGTTSITAKKGTVSSTAFSLTVKAKSTGMRLHVQSSVAAKIYAWTGTGTTAVKLAGEWPGTAMTSEGNGYYYFDFPEAKPINVIFIGSDFTYSKGTGQTDDLTRDKEGWYYKNGTTWMWVDKDPVGPQPPTITVSPPGGRFKTTQDITLNVSFDSKTTAVTQTYTLDGTDPKINGQTFTNGFKTTIGADMLDKEVKTIKVYAKATATSTGEVLETSIDYTYTKGELPLAPFAWENAAVYFVMTDRFENGDTTNDRSYGRECDSAGTPLAEDYTSMLGTFNGGDIKGLIKKLDEGYFTKLGVNVIWMTSPVEQIHGWVGGSPFKHYGYHGYYALDFTEVDKNMGTYDDLKTFVDKAHEKGIRIVFDTVINHSGYETVADIREFGFGAVNTGWESYYTAKDSDANSSSISSLLNFTSQDWSKWWGVKWIRKNGLPGYSPMEASPKGEYQFNLPDFKTESTETVDIPDFLVRKWGGTTGAKYLQEKKELDDFFTKTGRARTPRNFLIKWATDWVRELGVDGFRLDTVNNIEIEAAKELSIEGHRALKEWKAANPAKKLDDLEFWMTGEAYDLDPVSNPGGYMNNGFDSMINFQFPKSGDTGAIGGTWKYYADTLNGSNTHLNSLSYISSHDKGLTRGDMKKLGTCLLLTPGAAQIFYGDESGRPSSFNGEAGSRSKMNWGQNLDILAHWQKVGFFRNNHLAVGGGSQSDLGDSTYGRKYNKNGNVDNVVIKINASGSAAVNVSGFFEDGKSVRDAYTGNTATVSGGKATFTADSNGVILIEEIK